MRVGVNVRLLLGKNMEGISRFIFETTRQMALSHPEDEFILFFDRKVNADFGFPSNVRKVIVPWHARHPIIWHVWFEYMLPFYFRLYQIDVFYSGDGYLSLRSKIPTVMVIHDLAYLHYPEHIQKASLDHYRKYVPKYLAKASVIITVSEYVKADIAEHFGIDPTKIKVAPNAIRPYESTAVPELPSTIKEKLPDRPYFLYVGALHPRKNIITLIEAFRQFNAAHGDQYCLVLAGRLAWKTEAIEQAIRSVPGVIYTGTISEDLKYRLIKGAIALTYISLFEGFGIPILEAMMMGTPVITSNVTSMPEVAGEAAILVAPNHTAEIAKAMDMLLNVDLRNQLIQKGLRRVSDFSWENSADIIYGALKSAYNHR